MFDKLKQSNMADDNKEVFFQFKCSKAVLNSLENHFDHTKIKMRKLRPDTRINKKVLYEFLLEQSIKQFDINEFIKATDQKQ